MMSEPDNASTTAAPPGTNAPQTDTHHYEHGHYPAGHPPARPVPTRRHPGTNGSRPAPSPPRHAPAPAF
jgi:hypothetical protein